VVIAIIAVLASMLLPALERARRQGVSVSCQSNLKQTMETIHMYAENCDGWLDLSIGPGKWSRKVIKGGFSEQKEIFHCPGWRPETYDQGVSSKSTYGARKHEWDQRGTTDALVWGNVFVAQALNLYRIEKTSSFDLFMDTYKGGGGVAAGGEWWAYHSNISFGGGVQVRHLESANCVFVDGHVESIPVEGLYSRPRLPIEEYWDRQENKRTL